MSLPTELDELLGHTEAVRHLARRLVLDDDQADDVLQDACLAALERPPPNGVPLRAWIIGIVRRLAARRLRGDARRRRREAARPVRSPTCDPRELAERAEAHRQLVKAVLALRDPYRTALLLRFFDGLRILEIAGRLGIPAATVSTHLHRGIAMLRERLDAQHGGRRMTWFLTLLPVATRGGTRPLMPAPSALSVGVAFMSTKIAVGGLALLLLGAVLVGLTETRKARGPNPNSTRTDASPTPTLSGAKAPATRAARSMAQADARPPTTPIDPRRDLHGAVVDEAGRGIAGAHVAVLGQAWTRFRVFVPGTSEEDAEPAREVVTNPDGRFRIRLRKDTCTDLRVRAPGFASIDRFACTAGEDLRIVLPKATAVRVTVLDEHDTPIAGAALKLWRNPTGRDGLAPRRGRTGPEGTSTFTELPRGAWGMLEVTHADFAPLGWRRVDFPPAGPAAVSLTLRAGRTLRGRVLDAQTGDALAGARVGIGWTLRKAVTADADGRFELRGWASETTPCLYAIAEGHASSWLAPPFPRSIEFRLERGATVKGRVVSTAGDPVPGARVALRSAQGADTRATTCDAQGRFGMTGVRRGCTHAFLLLAPGFGRTRIDVDVPDTQMFDLGDVALAEGHGFSGRVVHADGAPAGDIAVEVEGEGRDRETRCTDASGAFRFAALAAGTWKVRAKPIGQRWIEAEVTLGLSSEPAPVLLRLHDERLLRVRVVDDAGRPIAYAHVAAKAQDGYGITSMTDVGGRAEIRSSAHIASLEVTGGFTGEDYFAPPLRTVEPGERDVEIVMPRAHTAHGTVVDPEGKPVAQAVLEATVGGRPLTQTSQFSGNQVWSNAEGRFQVLLPAEGRVDLTAMPLVRGGQVLGGRLEGLGTDTPRNVLQLSPLVYDRQVTVRALAPDGTPAGDVQVYARVAATNIPGANARTDVEGRAVLRGLPREAVAVYARALPGDARADLWTGPVVYPVRAGNGLVEVRFEQAVIITGRVIDGKGQAVAGAAVAIGTRDRQTASATTGEDGAFRFRVSPSLDFPLRLMARLGQVVTPAVDVARDHRGPITLVVSR